MDELRAAVRDLATTSDVVAADVLVKTLHRYDASPELAAFIVQTLEMSALHEVRDSEGVSVRYRLIDRLLELGFPHALNVSPEDLDYHRATGGGRPLSWMAFLTGTASIISLLWSLLLCLLFFSVARDESRHLYYWLGLAGVGLSLFHAGSALGAAIKVQRRQPAPMLKTLGWMFFAGPILAALCELLQSRGALVALVFGAPAMVTAILCEITHGTIGNEPVIPAFDARRDEEEEVAQPARVSVR